jgi:hypothetical protein
MPDYLHKLNNTKQYVEDLLNEKRIGVDLHCHFEGILSCQNLREVAEIVTGQDLFEKSTWELIEQTMGNNSRSLSHFFSKLSGKWIRVICIAANLKYEIPINTTLKAFIKKAFEVMYGQGICKLELMISVFTLSSEGDFSIVPLLQPSTDEINKYVSDWNKRENGVRAPNISELLGLFTEVANGDSRWCLANRKLRALDQMEIGLKYMIRREKEKIFRNKSKQLDERIDQVVELFKSKTIVGVDIAGNEYDPEGCVSNYEEFLKELKKRGVPFTIHAGEISSVSPSKDLSYKNLIAAINYGAKRIGHAVRLFDYTEEMSGLLERLILDGIFIELNITSNFWTGAVQTDDADQHPVIKALNGIHPLLQKKPHLLRELKELVIVCDDDPVVVSDEGLSMQKELSLYISHTTKTVSYDIVESLLMQQKLLSNKAALWQHSKKDYEYK